MKILATSAFAALATGLVAPAATALDFGNGFSLKGDVEVEYLSEGGDGTSYAFTDLTLGWRSQGGGAFGVGVDLSVTGIKNFEEDNSSHYTWASLVLTTAYGELAIGRPRAVLDGMFDTPQIGGTQIFDSSLVFFGNGSSVTFFTQTLDSDVTGVTFKGAQGNLSYGVGMHRLRESVFGIDADVVEAAMTYQLGNTKLFAGAELVDPANTSATDIEKILFGARHDAERWSAGLVASKLSVGRIDFKTYTLFGDYKVTEALTVGAQILRIEQSGFSSDIYGLSSEYGFGSGGFAGLGVVMPEDSPDDRFTASVGYRF